jgi:hypothetical protein
MQIVLSSSKILQIIIEYLLIGIENATFKLYLNKQNY